MEEPNADSAPVSARWARWNSWRGSPALIARIARVAVDVVADHREGVPSCQIEVAVEGDTEVFDSPSDFADYVSPEALRHLRSLVIRTTSADLAVTVEFLRKTLSEPAAPAATGAILRVEAADDADSVLAEALNTLRPVVDRGRGWLSARPAEGSGAVTSAPKENLAYRVVDFVVSLGVVAVVAVSLSLVYLVLPFLPDEVPDVVGIVAPVVGLVIAGAVMGLIRPRVEVASPGQARIVRIGVWLVGALAASGLALVLERIVFA